MDFVLGKIIFARIIIIDKIIHSSNIFITPLNQLFEIILKNLNLLVERCLFFY